MKPEMATLRGWIGRTESTDDVAAMAPLRALAATLDRDEMYEPGDPIPPCWHWLYFLSTARQSDIGPDGHPRRGGFLPPVPLPRRMWAGNQIEFLAPLRAGQRLQRRSLIEDIQAKTGRSGPLVFVTVRHEVRGDDTLAVNETQNIVYRDMPTAEPPPRVGRAAPATAVWSRRITPDPVLLFRYSALTFNGHRIHYDRKYVTEVEGYPGLIVHGPLIATLLLDLVRRERPHVSVRHFKFRALKPLFDTAPFTVCGCPTDGDGGVSLWTRDAAGEATAQASAILG